MNELKPQTHEIVVYRNQKSMRVVSSIVVLGCLLTVGSDAFALWAFWNHYEIDTGAYVTAFVILPIGTVVMGWCLFAMLYRLRQRGPAITINAQGFFFSLPLRFAFVPQFRQSFLPWEEIEWIASFQSEIYTWLSLSLKDPAHYWSLYGNGPFRTWHRDVLTRGHINVAQYTLSLSARQILQQIEENYRSELLKYEIKMRIEQVSYFNI